MSRTGIYISTRRGAVTVYNPTGHIELENDDDGQIDITEDVVQMLIASIGDPATGRSNTGHLTLIVNNKPYTVFLRKSTGRQLEWLDTQPQPSFASRLTFTNDWAIGEGIGLEETSITIHTMGSFHPNEE